MEVFGVDGRVTQEIILPWGKRSESRVGLNASGIDYQSVAWCELCREVWSLDGVRVDGVPWSQSRATG